MTDPLETLWIALDEHGEVPIGCDLASSWQTSESPAALYSLGGIGIDRVALVMALVACARLVVDDLPRDDARPRAVLAAAERWIDGHADVADVRQADDAAMDAWHAASRAGDKRLCTAITAVLGPASVIAAKPSQRPPSRAVHALDCAAIVAGRARVCAALRATLRCPTLATVLG